MDDLYQENFFKNSSSVVSSEHLPEALEKLSLTPSKKLESQSQFFFLRLLAQDIQKQFSHCPHIQLTLQKLEKTAGLEDQKNFLRLLDTLEEFLDVEYLKQMSKK